MTAATAPVTVIGGGLAGCEAAWQLLRRGHRVRLCEMKPDRFSPAHKSPHLAELVCSNSLRSASLENAVGLLKEEMRRMDSLIMAAADATAVPAGKALAVDRNAFSRLIEERLAAQPGLEMIRGEVTEIPADGIDDHRLRPPHLRRPRRRDRRFDRRRISLLLRRDLPDHRGGIHRSGAASSPPPVTATARRTT